ncbi:MAG: glycosyltransferase, partial [Bacteroidetes bacterium]
MPVIPTVDIVFALTGDVRRNSRALKQLRLFTGLGARVEVLCLGPTRASVAFEPGLHLEVFPHPPGAGPPFFARVHRLFRREALARPARVYHASDLYTLPALATAARRYGARLAYDARECYPHVSATAGRPWVRRFWQSVEGRYVRRADAVFTVSAPIAEHMARVYGIPRPGLVYNVPPRRDVRPAGRLHTLAGVPPGHPLILHQGHLRQARGLPALVDALQDVPDATLVFLGDGPLRPRLEAQTRRLGLTERIRFLDPVPPDDLLPLTADATLGVSLLEDTCLNHRYALPNKVFEYLMAGVPVLASDLPEIRRVVAGHDVGEVVDPANRPGLVAALRHMCTDLDARRRWTANIPRV